MPRKKSSDIPATLAWLRSELEQASDSKFAEGQRWFFKHEVDTWGVRTKELHRIARDQHHKVKSWPLADRNKLCTELWKSGKLEEGALVCYVYRRFKAECHECEFRLFERWLDRYVNNWAHCDGLSSWLLAASLANEPALTVELAGWTTSPNRWRRRAAAVSLIQEAKAGRHTEVIFDIAARLAALNAAIHGELDQISQALTLRVKELAERYETALPQVSDRVAELESKVSGHLHKMGFEWN